MHSQSSYVVLSIIDDSAIRERRIVNCYCSLHGGSARHSVLTERNSKQQENRGGGGHMSMFRVEFEQAIPHFVLSNIM